jgi:hypothetical protein
VLAFPEDRARLGDAITTASDGRGLLVAAAWSPPNILCPRTPLRPARGAILLHAGTPSTDSLLCSGTAVELWHEGGLAVVLGYELAEVSFVAVHCSALERYTQQVLAIPAIPGVVNGVPQAKGRLR